MTPNNLVVFLPYSRAWVSRAPSETPVDGRLMPACRSFGPGAQTAVELAAAVIVEDLLFAGCTGPGPCATRRPVQHFMRQHLFRHDGFSGLFRSLAHGRQASKAP